MTNVYHYRADTGEFAGSSSALLDPLDAQPLVPAHATLIEPPASRPRKVAVFSDGQWSLEDDFRGTEYWLPDGSFHKITKIGEAPSPDALGSKPPESHAAQRSSGLSTVDARHGAVLIALSGGASQAERDTWTIKQAAARALLAENATPVQKAMIDAEANARGVSSASLSQTIVSRADGFMSLIGAAAALRAQARAAIVAATDEAVPIEQVADRVADAVSAFEGAADRLSAGLSGSD